jgi:hypothetical protein
VGLDDNGEPTYRITKKCEEVFPEFYAYHRSMMNSTANELWQMGVIEMKFNAKGETVTFNYQNYTRLKEVMHELTSEQLAFLSVLGAPIERLAE